MIEIPIYKCPKCGRVVEKPLGRYYCRVCGPTAMMVKVGDPPQIAVPKPTLTNFRDRMFNSFKRQLERRGIEVLQYFSDTEKVVADIRYPDRISELLKKRAKEWGVRNIDYFTYWGSKGSLEFAVWSDRVHVEGDLPVPVIRPREVKAAIRDEIVPPPNITITEVHYHVVDTITTTHLHIKTDYFQEDYVTESPEHRGYQLAEVIRNILHVIERALSQGG